MTQSFAQSSLPMPCLYVNDHIHNKYLNQLRSISRFFKTRRLSKPQLTIWSPFSERSCSLFILFLQSLFFSYMLKSSLKDSKELSLLILSLKFSNSFEVTSFKLIHFNAFSWEEIGSYPGKEISSCFMFFEAFIAYSNLFIFNLFTLFPLQKNFFTIKKTQILFCTNQPSCGYFSPFYLSLHSFFSNPHFTSKISR